MAKTAQMTYVQIQDRIEQMLQDITNATYDTTELGYWIAEGLKELATYDPHIIPVTYKIEARTGTATTDTTTKTLDDTTNDQFLASDVLYEKVVYNTTDETWATITSYTDADTVGLSADIMVSGEGYKIYNKRCYNSKQVYIGDVGDYLWIEAVEYKCQQSPRDFRNWKLYGDVLEIDIDFTPTDGDEVNVYFAKPHRLCQLTDLDGTVYHETPGNSYPVGNIAVVTEDLTNGEWVYVGDEFYIAGHRNPYTCTEDKELSDQADGGSVLYFNPGLEAPAADDAVITFVKSTLKPQHEELFCHLVAARAVLSDNIRHIDAIPTGGPDTWLRYQQWGERKLGEVLGKLDRLSPPRTKRIYPR